MTESGDRNTPSPSPKPDEPFPLNKDQFLYPQSRYYGDFTPENLTFNSNLQEFASRVSIICNLETNGKIAPQEAYDQIKNLWEQLENSKTQLLKEE